MPRQKKPVEKNPKEKPKKKAKVGRPNGFDKIDLKLVEFLTKKGCTDQEMAEYFGVTVRTWHSWKAKNESFLHSLKDWRLEFDEKIERSLAERAKGCIITESKVVVEHDGKKTKTITKKEMAPDTAAAFIWLKNRKPQEWRDRRENINENKHTLESDLKAALLKDE